MFRFAAALMAGIAFTALATVPAAAQIACGDHGKVTSSLESKFSETRVGIGLDDDGRVIEVFASPKGTWTLLVTYPDGTTCLVGSGEAWEDSIVKLSGPTA